MENEYQISPTLKLSLKKEIKSRYYTHNRIQIQCRIAFKGLNRHVPYIELKKNPDQMFNGSVQIFDNKAIPITIKIYSRVLKDCALLP